jgi:SAM-dependent methyltransferase
MTSSSSAAFPAVVETFDADVVMGWVAVPQHAAPPTVELFADDLRIDHTLAVDATDRHASADVRAFRFPLADVWDFVGPGNRLSVKLGGRVVPIAGHGMFRVPERAGERTLAELRSRLAAGEIFNRSGVLQLPKALDAQWQAAVLALYARLKAEIADEAGYDVFLMYGTLLGAIRESGFLGADLDFDSAFVSRHHDAAAAARELQQLAFALIDRGYAVQATRSYLRIADLSTPDVTVDLFHLFFSEDGRLQFPHGVAGDGAVTESSWSGLRELPFAGENVLVPADAEAFLEHLYGSGWRTPDPTFTWARRRISQASDALLAPAAVEEVYWADFYARTTYTSGSTFFELVNARADTPQTVVDIGCGDGRDSYAFAAAGRRKVTGLDRSHVGVRQAGRKAEQLGYGDILTFTACDVGDERRLRETLLAARDGDEPMLYYARFFLHSIPESVQRILMAVVAETARPGDYFAAEFRTDKDEAMEKVHGNHYRRFQNGPGFGRALSETYGFTPLLTQEGNGFSPYKGEDPQLYRVIAVRPR